MTTAKVERLVGSFLTAEGPHWDEETSSLYFVDALGKAIHRFTPSTNSLAKASGRKVISFIIPVEGQPERFLIGYSEEVCLIKWDGKSGDFSVLKSLAVLTNADGDYVWNDAKVDSRGRLWAGSLSLKPGGGYLFKRGSLYSMSSNYFLLKKHVQHVSLSNGLAWNDLLKKLYYVDSFEDAIYQFDYDSDGDGSVSNQEVIFSFKKNGVPGMPDGMTIDTDGNLWVASFEGHRVIKIDPRKPNTVLETIELPTEQVTSVAFGGKNLDELYVTTANLNLERTDEFLREGSEHGALYRVTGLGVRGSTANKVKLENATSLAAE